MEKPVSQHPASRGRSCGLCRAMAAPRCCRRWWPAHTPPGTCQITPHRSPVRDAVLLGSTAAARFRVPRPRRLCRHLQHRQAELREQSACWGRAFLPVPRRARIPASNPAPFSSWCHCQKTPGAGSHVWVSRGAHQTHSLLRAKSPWQPRAGPGAVAKPRHHPQPKRGSGFAVVKRFQWPPGEKERKKKKKIKGKKGCSCMK